MLKLLENKYTEIFEEFYKKEDEIAERNFQKLLHSTDRK